MTVYVTIDIEVTDGATYKEYMRRVPATIEKYGGRYLARGGKVTPLAGN